MSLWKLTTFSHPFLVFPRFVEGSMYTITGPVETEGSLILKGTISRDFRLQFFFHESVSLKPLSTP
jgi:hypothetical protein